MDAVQRGERKKLWAWMTGAGMLALLISYPSFFAMARSMSANQPPPLPLWALMALQYVQTSVMIALVVWVGVLLAPRVGTDAPLFRAKAEGRPLPAGWSRAVPGSIAAGVVAGVVITVLAVGVFQRHLPASFREAPRMGPGYGLLATFYGGVVEELLLRWGMLTVLAWLLERVRLGRTAAFWSANVLAALIFGAGHLPLAVQLTGGLTPMLVAYALVLNGIGGVVYGALYRRHGLEQGMIAHASTDVVLHVIVPAVALLTTH
jgi:membrane protease YdiL (CAAX protease family)